MKRIEHYTTYLDGGAGAAAQRIYDGIRSESLSSSEINSLSKNEPGNLETLNRGDSEYKFELYCREDQKLVGKQVDHFHPADGFFQKTWPRKWNRKSFKQAAEHYHSHLKSRPADYEVFSPARLYEPTSRSTKLPIDLVHLHWIAFLIDYPTFFASIPRTVPIVWTLHDMNAFTGGCHYNAGCNKFKTGCGNCFQLASPSVNDLSSVAWHQKQRSFQDRDLTIVAPCQWLLDQAATSTILPSRTQFKKIHYGLDTQQFFPEDQGASKAELGLDPRKTTLAFGAADVTNPRKGMNQLIDALSKIPSPDEFECVVFGGGKLTSEMLGNIGSQLRIHEIGFLNSPSQQRKVYSAADIYLLPSLEDNQPQTGLESLACGTPVIAFDTGGISEFVQQGVTGLLANVNDTQDFAKQILWLATHSESRRSFGAKGLELIREQFEVRRQSRAYLDLYQEKLKIDRRTARRAG